MIIRHATPENIADAQFFLERHAETSLFLLSNLATLGHTLGESINSGNFKLVEADGALCGVYCLTRRGNLLVETGGRTDCAASILEACRAEPIPIAGIVAEWRIANAIWKILTASGEFVETYASQEALQCLKLNDNEGASSTHVRPLGPDDFPLWDPLNLAYLEEEGLPLQGTLDQRCANFKKQALARQWWGYFEGEQLVAMTALNAIYKTLGQVGGVYTTPERRRQGFSRAAMLALIADSKQVHRLENLILFTGEQNRAAQRMYTSLGFAHIGEFALLFGSWLGRRQH